MTIKNITAFSRQLSQSFLFVENTLKQKTALPKEYYQDIKDFLVYIKDASENGEHSDAIKLTVECLHYLDIALKDSGARNYQATITLLREEFSHIQIDLGTLLAKSTADEHAVIAAFDALRLALQDAVFLTAHRKWEVTGHIASIAHALDLGLFELLPAMLLVYRRAFDGESDSGPALKSGRKYREIRAQMVKLQRLATRFLDGRYRVDYTFPEDEPDDS